jgi:hypothetical protein
MKKNIDRNILLLLFYILALGKDCSIDDLKLNFRGCDVAQF